MASIGRCVQRHAAHGCSKQQFDLWHYQTCLTAFCNIITMLLLRILIQQEVDTAILNPQHSHLGLREFIEKNYSPT